MAKYKNKKVVIDGMTFDSIKEAKRYQQLLLKQKTGWIRDLQMQVKYVLIPAQYETVTRYGKKGQRLKDGKKLLERECSYTADFVYYDVEKSKTIVEDVKGYRKDGAYNIFTIKRKLMLWIHGIKVEEI